jgi:hypothetical protein
MEVWNNLVQTPDPCAAQKGSNMHHPVNPYLTLNALLITGRRAPQVFLFALAELALVYPKC